MPPQQCPECGRFLKNDLVTSLVRAPAPCPKCEIELTPRMFGLDVATDTEPTSAADAGGGASPTDDPDPAERTAAPAGSDGPLPARPAVPTPVATSVRPPDLAPDTVRDVPDPLSGWDAGVAAPVVRDQPPFPTDTVVVLGAAAVGFLAGALVADERCRSAALGAVGGAVGAAAARRIWRLP